MKKAYYTKWFLSALMICFFASAEAAHVKVILLGGQSNMDGRAPGSGLPTTPYNLQAAQTDVLLYHGNASGQAYLPGNTLINLAPGSGSKSPSSPTFGPEVTFGRAIADAYPAETFALIKYALGGSKLATGWNPSTGATYTAFRNTVTNGLAALTSAGYTYEIAGMLWMQGESDSTLAYANAYQVNLTAFIADIRSRYGAGLPFVICETWRNEGDATHPGTLGDIVSAAQQNVANADARVGFVSTRSLTFQDAYHLNAQGQINVGYGCADFLISNNLLSSAVVPSNPQADVAGHWSFDSDYSDISGSGWNGTLTDVGTIGNSGITHTVGEYKFGGGALNLSGDKDYVGIQDTWVSGTGYSVAFWAKDRNAVNDQDGMVIGKNTTTNDLIWVEGKFGGLRYRAGSSTYTADFATGAEDTAWHHYVVVVGGGNVSCYKDGVFKGTVTGKGYGMSINAIGDAYSGTQNYDYDGQIDEVWVFSNAIDPAVVASLYHSNSPYPSAGSPNPANGQGLATDPAAPLYAGVNTNQILSWSAPADPNLDPAYTITYSVYADPNQTKVINGDPTSTYYRRFTDAGAATRSLDPTPDIAYNTTCYWRVDSKAKKTGQTDPNIITGPIWKFKTVSILPTVVTDPVNTKVNAGQTATFTVTYQSAGTITGVTWYKNGGALPADIDYSVAWNQTSSTLTVANAELFDEASYHCVVSTSDGTDSSAAALLVLNKKLAWYRFENNADDSVGTNHGTPVNGMAYTSDVIVKTGGQLYAADPNSGYISLPKDAAYPRAGFGNGLDQGSIACWVKCASGQGGRLLAQNAGTGGQITSLQLYVDGGNAKIYLRDDDNEEVSLSGAKIDDGQWHYVVVTIDGGNVTLYVDVTNDISGSNALDKYTAWDHDMPIMAFNNRGTISTLYTGDLDDLVITNYVLSAEEMAQEYYNAKGIRTCLYELVGDFNNDCKVTMADFAMLAQKWCESGLYPQP